MLLVQAGVNDANMLVSRSRETCRATLTALSIDTPAPSEVIGRLREGLDDAYLGG
jgi:hypothetical protein